MIIPTLQKNTISEINLSHTNVLIFPIIEKTNEGKYNIYIRRALIKHIYDAYIMEILTHSVCEIDIIPVLRLLYMIIYSVEEYEIITAVSNFNKEKNIFYVFFFF